MTDVVRAAFGVDALERPEWLWLLLALVALVLFRAWRQAPPALPWSGLEQARRAGARRFDALRATALALRAAALVLLALVIAGPVGVRRLPPEPGFGLDLILVVDASGSMRALDAEVDGQWRTRLDLAREVVGRFAEKRVASGDRVGLVVFGESAFTQCPLTSDGELLAAALARVRPGVAGESTALGDALALAVKRALGAGDRGETAGRVVVLLTDGRSNAGSISAASAAGLAAGESIRVHAVGIGSSGTEVAMQTEGPAGRGLRFERHDVDPAALDRIARTTGGRFFAAQRSADLDAVYTEIDALERVPRTRPPRVARAERSEPFLALAAACLACEIGAARVLRRRLP